MDHACIEQPKVKRGEKGKEQAEKLKVQPLAIDAIAVGDEIRLQLNHDKISGIDCFISFVRLFNNRMSQYAH